MKEKTVLEIKNKVDSMRPIVQSLVMEVMRLSDLSTGILETIKLMPGYSEAIEDLKNTQQVSEDKG
jgi:hypothetical protein